MPGTKKMGMYKKHKTAKGMPKKKGMPKMHGKKKK
jgi:hypothetical protein